MEERRRQTDWVTSELAGRQTQLKFLLLNMKSFAVILGLFGAVAANIANQSPVVQLVSNTGVTASSPLVVPVSLRYTCDNHCRLVTLGTENGFSFWDVQDPPVGWTNVRTRTLSLPYGEHVLAFQVENSGDKGMLAFSLSINNGHEYAVSNDQVWCSTSNPNADLAWRNVFDFKHTPAYTTWQPACVYGSGQVPGEAGSEHPDWNSQNLKPSLMFNEGNTPQTTAPSYVMSRCGNPNLDASVPKTAWCRYRFTINRGTTSNAPRR